MKEKDFINKSKEKWVKLEEIVFENKKNANVKIIANGEEKTIGEGLKIFSVGVNFLDLQSILVEYENETMDLFPIIKSVKHSLIRLVSSVSEI